MRLFIFFAVVLASSSGYAQNLYKWVEPDGSITFSTNPPKTGTAYEKVIQEQSVKAASSSQANQTVITPSNNQPSQRTPIKQLDVTPAQASVSQAQSSTNPLQTAPNLGVQLPGSANRSLALDAMQATKMNHCQDLKKRVVSLERRLKTRLTPEDMDNTVVHMARYQRSFDQHCLQ